METQRIMRLMRLYVFITLYNCIMRAYGMPKRSTRFDETVIIKWKTLIIGDWNTQRHFNTASIAFISTT